MGTGIFPVTTGSDVGQVPTVPHLPGQRGWIVSTHPTALRYGRRSTRPPPSPIFPHPCGHPAGAMSQHNGPWGAE